MGKQSKNGTGSGGDERNMYYRRYKSTSNPSKASTNDHLTKRLTDSESSSRSMNSGSASQQYTTIERSNAKSKLRSPVKVGLGQSMNRGNKPNTISDNKEVKKPAAVSKTKSQLTKMKQDTATADQKQIPVNIQTENKETVEEIETKVAKELTPAHQENGDSNGMHKNGTSLESNENANGQVDQNGEGLEANEKAEEFNLQLEVDENCFALEEMLEVPSQITTDETTEKQLEDFLEEVKDDSKVDTESYSVDVVESTTSETSEATESSPSEIKEKNNKNDTEGVKDANVEGCAKTPQSEEETKADQSSSTAGKEKTFGKTLRTISGRHSIGRMRQFRDRQASPNSSLFVNTSSASASDDGDSKFAHRRTPTADLSSTNGTEKFFERKRKLIEESFNTQKKIKADESSGSFLNSSFELLKKPFRRSVKISTPVKTEKEQIQPVGGELVKYGESGIRKWCSIM